MPGDNCAFNKCGVNRRTKGVGLFKLPKGKDVEHEKWRRDILNVLTKFRVQDDNFKRQLANDSLHICERHFLEEEILIFE